MNPQVQPETLLAQYVATGEGKYLSQLIELFNQSLFHYLLSQVAGVIAEDVLQTTWLKVISSAASFNHHDNQANVKAWLFTIARYTLIDELRKQNKWQLIDRAPEQTDDERLTSGSLEQHVNDEQLMIKFNQAIERLPFLQREAFIFQQEGFSLQEICMLTDESFETVKSRLRYARNHLRHYLYGANQ